jgi:hypothetical protein
MTVNFINAPNLKLLAEVWAEIIKRKECADKRDEEGREK